MMKVNLSHNLHSRHVGHILHSIHSSPTYTLSLGHEEEGSESYGRGVEREGRNVIGKAKVESDGRSADDNGNSGAYPTPLTYTLLGSIGKQEGERVEHDGGNCK
jgi:hypothetical protein